MEYKKTAIEGVYIIEPRVFNDARGYFFEAWKQQEFEENIGPTMNRSLHMVFYVVCITKKVHSHSPNWYVLSRAVCSMLPSICVVPALRLASM